MVNILLKSEFAKGDAVNSHADDVHRFASFAQLLINRLLAGAR